LQTAFIKKQLPFVSAQTADFFHRGWNKVLLLMSISSTDRMINCGKKLTRKWRQQGPPKRRYPATSLHSVTTQKTATWIFTFINTSSFSSPLVKSNFLFCQTREHCIIGGQGLYGYVLACW